MMPSLLGKINQKHILILIIFFALFTRLFRLDYPKGYVFDEVYHAFTAREYLKGHQAAWEYWTSPPPGVAYEWTHPPLAKEFMAASMYIFQTEDAWAYRLPGALLGALSVFLVYLLGLKLLQNKSASLIAAFVFSLDGLNFVQSRTGMNDIYFVTFFLASLLLLLNKKFLLASLMLGLALASKWAAVYSYLIFLPLLLLHRNYLKILLFILIPPSVYFISYLPFFLLGHDLNQFIQLQQQMWWYHTGLKATHTYTSPWWSWPLNLYPVWYFVDYQKTTMANIFTAGNPAMFWFGAIAVILTLVETIKKRTMNLFIMLLGFFAFWLPWALSPRIMFLYHFSPSVPFLSLALGYQINKLLKDKSKKGLAFALICLIIISFILIFPYLTGIPLPRDFIKIFFMTNLSKNPF